MPEQAFDHLNRDSPDTGSTAAIVRTLNLVASHRGMEGCVPGYAAHKHAKVRRWLTQHPRWIFHFTPTSCSWLNAVETVFAKLAKRRLKRGVFPSLVSL